jgi:acyl carrier protein
MTNEDLRVAIKHLIISELDLRGKTAEQIVDDEPLFGAGLGLDSLDALQLAMAIEERFGIQVPEGDEAKEIFASVTALADFVRRTRGE